MWYFNTKKCSYGQQVLKNYLLDKTTKILMRWASRTFPGCSEWLHLLLSHFLKTFFWDFRCRIISPIITYMLIYFVPFNCQHEWLVSSLTSMYTLGNPFSSAARGVWFSKAFFTLCLRCRMVKKDFQLSPEICVYVQVIESLGNTRSGECTAWFVHSGWSCVCKPAHISSEKQLSPLQLTQPPPRHKLS